MSALRDEMLTGEVAAPYGQSEAAGPWVMFWSAVWVGVLTAFALVVVFGLLSIAVGASPGVPMRGYTRWRDFGAGAIFLAVLGAFLSFVAAGWTTGKIIGPHRAEVGMLHGAIVWLLAVPLLLLMGTLGSATFFGAWYGGLVGVPAWVAMPPLGQVSPEAAAVARQAAIAGLSALLISLMGAVVGGWMASGEPMSLTHYRTRGRARIARPSAI